MSITDDPPVEISKRKEEAKARWKAYRLAVLSRVDWSSIYADLNHQRPTSESWISCQCPFHPDGAHNSFAFNAATGGWKCFSGCGEGSGLDFLARRDNTDWKAALRALGDRVGVDPPTAPAAGKRGRPPRREVAAYDYTDEAGTLLFQVVRYDPKDFRQRIPDPATPGGWTWKVRGVRKPLYRLPAVVAAVAAGDPIYIPEGEKDCDTLAAWGLAATTNSGGAGRWLPEHSEALRGARVVILPDQDAAAVPRRGPGRPPGGSGGPPPGPPPASPGRAHAIVVASSLRGIAASVQVLDIPPSEGKDVTEWAQRHGGTRERLLDLVETAPLADEVLALTPTSRATSTSAPAVGGPGSESSSEAITPSLSPPSGGARGGSPGGPVANGLPTIILREALAEVADEAVAALVAHGARSSFPPLFVRDGVMVRVSQDSGRDSLIPGITISPSQPVIAPVPTPALREQVDRAAHWAKINRRSGDLEPTMPPPWVAETIGARSTWPLPRLTAVIEQPTLRLDGSVLSAPGYDAPSGLLHLPSAEYPPIPDHPTIDDARAALHALWDPLQDIPVVAQSDISAIVASILTLTCRHAFIGPAPLFACSAPTPGTGKGLLTDVISIIGTGREPARLIVPRDPTEMGKSLLAIAIGGAPVVLLDNISHPLGDDALAAALTSCAIEGRLLGFSRQVRVSLSATWLATGNGMSYVGDFGRRVIPISIDSKTEHPEDRANFAYPDLRPHATHARPALTVAALTIVRAYHVAGRPRHGSSRMGSFEGWDDLVRGACTWIGLEDPTGGRARVRSEGDADLEALRGTLTALRAVFGVGEFTAGEAVARAKMSSDLAEVLVAVAGDQKGEAINPIRLGKFIRKRCGRIAAGLRFERGRGAHGVAVHWRVVAEDDFLPLDVE